VPTVIFPICKFPSPTLSGCDRMFATVAAIPR
jgi:hypothetical protein